MAGPNMASTNNPLSGHSFPIDYLIEKAVEISVDKTLMKVDEFVDKAIKKIDEAYGQASTKFLEQVNEAQSVAQNVDEVVNKAVKRSYDQALAKFPEQATEAQSSTKKVQELIQKPFDEALAKFSERLSELSTSHRIQEAAETAGHTAIENSKGSEQKPMEIEEDEIVSAAIEGDSEDEDSEDPEDSFDKKCEHLRPCSIYAIHTDNSRKSMLAANKDSELILCGYLNGEIGKNESQNCHWKCISGPDDNLYFQNMKTRKSMGANPDRFHKMRPYVTSMLNDPGDNAKFSIQHIGFERFLLQTTISQNLYYVMERKNDGPVHKNGPQVAQALSIEYLIEKAVENAMNRALIKLDEYVYKAAKKIDATVERALDQAFTKFSEHVNGVQESTRKVEEAVQKALDEALLKISNRFKELPPTIRMEQDHKSLWR